LLLLSNIFISPYHNYTKKSLNPDEYSRYKICGNIETVMEKKYEGTSNECL
jgi:hypothetical protein